MGRWSYAPSIIEGVASMIGGGECYSTGDPWWTGCEVHILGLDDSTVPQAATSLGADRVYVVDDDPAVRRALTRLLRSRGFPTTSFGSAEELLAVGQPDDAPTCLVVDLRMPGLSGLELQDLLLQQGLDMAMVFISGRASLGSGIRAMKGGAVDFLEKPVSDETLLPAVRRALDQARRRRDRRSGRAALQVRYDTLTPRERDVFRLIVTGLLNKQVGAELGAAEKTIKVHRARVMHKMEAGSLVELVRMADTLGRPDAAVDHS